MLPKAIAFTVAAIMFLSAAAYAGERSDPFRQLEEILPTPNAFRTASGAPGPEYWQQRADYVIEVELDDELQRIEGHESIRYYNLSPDPLNYLWLQLDQNRLNENSDNVVSAEAPDFDEFPFNRMRTLVALKDFDGGFDVQSVKDVAGDDLPYTVVKTMMRIDLPEPLAPGDEFSFSVSWAHNINNHEEIWGRGGYEHFPDDDNYIYEIALFYPRMAAYTDVTGWKHKQILGNGEFTLEFGDFELRITAPDDHIVGATGVLQNANEVLSPNQRQRLLEAENSDQPIFVVTPEEALASQAGKSDGKKTWVFKAENVRDVAFASSRKFIWDAWQHVGEQGNATMAMSLYPNEAEPLWSQYSTQAIVHTLEVYSRYTFEFPYPVAYSVNGPVGGMEYPMICFNAPRPYDDASYWDSGGEGKEWKRSKYGLISVVIHEVGHNYFPMIVNTDERQWTWMDEGLNSFLQSIAEREWEDDYPRKRGQPSEIVEYMSSIDQVPIMTNSESLLQFSNNAYGKPATALNILRESILGRELFDFAFREYAQHWKFKRPMPADLFRTMEDASGIDLDWFWRGWFYSTAHTDIAINDLRRYELDTRDPDVEKKRERELEDEEPITISDRRYADVLKRVDRYPELKDFYNDFDESEVTAEDREKYREYMEDLEEFEKTLLETGYVISVVDFENLGGLVMPIILEIEYESGNREEVRLPAEIWRRSPTRLSKLFLTDEPIVSITVDPYLETADTNLDNNHWPRKPITSRFRLFKEEVEENPMRKKQESSEVTERENDKNGEGR